MDCPKCGTSNDDNNYRCTSCSTVLQAAPAAQAPPAIAQPTEVTALGGLIPYKNSAALTSYYLGIFSLVCGIFLGLPALFIGIKGLKFADMHPEVKGKVHAWVGIVCGGLTTLVSVVILVFLGMAFLRK